WSSDVCSSDLAVESRRQAGQLDLVVDYPNAQRIAPADVIEQGRLQRPAQQPAEGFRVFQVKQGAAVADDRLLAFGFDAEPLTQMLGRETPAQIGHQPFVGVLSVELEDLHVCTPHSVIPTAVPG